MRVKLRENPKKRTFLFKWILRIIAVQGVFFILFMSTLFFYNSVSGYDTSKQNVEALKEQQEFLNLPMTWIIIGPFNFILKEQVSHNLKIIQENSK